MPKKPIEILIDASLRCTQCSVLQSSGCDCWKECSCGWKHLAAEQCCNPQHAIDQHIQNNAEGVAFLVIESMRSMYRDPMNAASGGFQKTLRATIIREVKSALVRNSV